MCEKNIFRFSSSVIPKCDGEAMAAKFSCAFCETTAADDYAYVQNLFHRTVREVRKERERIVASHSIDDESSSVIVSSHPTMNIPSLSSSSSSNSSLHFLTTCVDVDKLPSTGIPLPPPLPTNLTSKSSKCHSQTSTNANNVNVSQSTPTKATHQSTPPSIAKRTQSKTSSVFSKIFK
jgi:hypothetical protein